MDLRDPSCAVPGHLNLPDLAMLWQCEDCGDLGRVVADRTAPVSPREFVWMRDPIRPAGAPASGRHRVASCADGS